ncbi:SMC-Scp complex subunit ScpB [Anaerofustis sp. NSJ-163]|uniref:SMC-Scp complex subunit ScpB n=1 Tax=Anaerofustis sp. NSJ-163 TaxID=2944391 RepID=UPI00209C36A8|nr:SMC-Scp complex subunit ScpB [Anaerofustis sp. NSJ-163]MCO8194309.1 SMC-Scp complex subunit ScpB [Anaerofustis sp. NSJ-163]
MSETNNNEFINKDENELLHIIESILFAVGDKVHIDTIKKVLNINEKYATSLLKKLQSEYDYNMRGVKLVRTDDTYQLTTRSEYFDYVKQILTNYNTTNLSQAALETLAIVAYKQPVTRLDIELVRGVKSSSSLDLLIDRGLVEQAGRLEDVIGKPMSFKTTKEFLRLAGIEKISELPDFENFINDLENHIDEQMEESGEQLMFTEKI